MFDSSRYKIVSLQLGGYNRYRVVNRKSGQSLGEFGTWGDAEDSIRRLENKTTKVRGSR